MRMLVICLLTATFLVNCGSVKSYEKELHSLKPMALKECSIHRFERNQEVYREGAMGGNGGKSGGGCGCS